MHIVLNSKWFHDFFGIDNYDYRRDCVRGATVSVRADNDNDSGGNTRTE